MATTPQPAATKLRERIVQYRKDIFLYARKNLRIIDKRARSIPLEANFAQRHFQKRISEQQRETGRVRAIVLKARQEGISTWVAARNIRRTTLYANQSALVVADQKVRGASLFGIYENYYRHLPDEVRPAKRYSNKGTQLWFDTPAGIGGLNSKINVGTARDVQTGRATTHHSLHASEVAWWDNAEDLWVGLAQSIPDEPGTEIVMESTANGVGGFFYDMWNDAVDGKNEYVPIFLPWFVHEEYTMPTTESLEAEIMQTLQPWERKALQGIEWEGELWKLTLQQLAWRRKKIKTDFRGDERAFRQEFPATPREAFLVSGNCLSGDTRIITPTGRVELSKLAEIGTATVLTQDRGGARWVEAEVRSFGVQPLMEIRLRRGRATKNLYATPEHLWFVDRYDTGGVSDLKETASLKAGDKLSAAFPRRHGRVKPSSIAVAHGMVYGDGNRTQGQCRVDLFGAKDLEMLRFFPEPETSPISGGVRVRNLPAWFKDRPPLSAHPGYLSGWLAGYIAADGCVSANGQLTLASANRDDLEFVRTVADHLGVVTYGVRSGGREGLYTVGFGDGFPAEWLMLSHHRARWEGAPKRRRAYRWVVEAVARLDRREEVFCAIVPGTRSFVLEDHILTHNCFFDEEQLLKYEESARPPLMRANMEQIGEAIAPRRAEFGYLRIWELPRVQGHYVIFADTAEGKQTSAQRDVSFADPDAERGGRDFCSADVFDTVSRRYVAQVHGRMAPEVFARQLNLLGRFYSVRLVEGKGRFPALIGVEQNHSSGETTLRYLKDGNYPRLYSHRHINRRTHKTTTLLGWRTSVENRMPMLDELARAIREESVDIPNGDTIRECYTFIRDDSGRPEAQDGTHDDRVISAAGALQMARHSRPPLPQRPRVPVAVANTPTGWADYGYGK